MYVCMCHACLFKHCMHVARNMHVVVGDTCSLHEFNMHDNMHVVVTCTSHALYMYSNMHVALTCICHAFCMYATCMLY